MINYDASNDIIRFNSSADRLLQALPLLKNGTIETLLFSGGSGDIYHPENKESLILKRYLKTINISNSCTLHSYVQHLSAMMVSPLCL